MSRFLQNYPLTDRCVKFKMLSVVERLKLFLVQIILPWYCLILVLITQIELNKTKERGTPTIARHYSRQSWSPDDMRVTQEAPGPTHNFLLPVLPQQSFPPPTMRFYEQTNNTEWGKVIQVRLIFAPFMNSFLGHNLRRMMDGHSRDSASSKRVFGGEWPHTLLGSRRRNETEKGTCQGRRNIGRSTNCVGLSNGPRVSFPQQ